MSDSFDSIPSPTNQTKALNMSQGDDTLSPASSAASSPVYRPSYNTANKQSSNNYEYPKQTSNPLADIAATSADLEDSILGGLLGGGSKKTSAGTSKSGNPTNSTTNSVKSGGRSTGKLDPIEKDPLNSSGEKIAPSSFRPKSSTSPRSSKPVTFSNANNLSAFDDSLEFKNSPPKYSQTMKTNDGSSKSSQMNVKTADSEDDFGDDFELPISSSPRSPTATFQSNEGSSGKQRSTSPVASSATNVLGSGNTATSATVTSESAGTVNTATNRANDDVDLGGFLPSFLDPDRRSRQRRYYTSHFISFIIIAGNIINDQIHVFILLP